MFSAARLHPLGSAHYYARRQRLLSLLPPHSILILPAADAVLAAAAGNDIILPSHDSKTPGGLWYHFFGDDRSLLRRPVSPSAFSRTFGYTPTDINDETMTIACFFKPALPLSLPSSEEEEGRTGGGSGGTQQTPAAGSEMRREGCVTLFVSNRTADPQEVVWGMQQPYSPEQITEKYLRFSANSTSCGPPTGRERGGGRDFVKASDRRTSSPRSGKDSLFSQDVAYPNTLPHILEIFLQYWREMMLIHQEMHWQLQQSPLKSIEMRREKRKKDHSSDEIIHSRSLGKEWLCQQRESMRLPQIFTVFPSQLRFGGVNSPIFRVRNPHYHYRNYAENKRHTGQDSESSYSLLPFLDFYHPLQFLLSIIESIDYYREVACVSSSDTNASFFTSSSTSSFANDQECSSSSQVPLLLHTRYCVQSMDMCRDYYHSFGSSGNHGSTGYVGCNAVVDVLSSLYSVSRQRHRHPLHQQAHALSSYNLQEWKSLTRATLQCIYPSLVMFTSDVYRALHKEKKTRVEEIASSSSSFPISTPPPSSLPTSPRRIFSFPSLPLQDGIRSVLHRYQAIKSPSQVRQHLRSAAATGFVFFEMFRRAEEGFLPQGEDPEHILSCIMQQAVVRLRASLGPRFPVDISYIPVIATGRHSMYLHYTDNRIEEEEEKEECSGVKGTHHLKQRREKEKQQQHQAPKEVLDLDGKGKGKSRRAFLSSGKASSSVEPPREHGDGERHHHHRRLVRVDAGVSVEYVPTDCTRTFPLAQKNLRYSSCSSPTFSSSFPLAPYEALVRLQQRLMKMLRVGRALQEIDVCHIQGTQKYLQELFSSDGEKEGSPHALYPPSPSHPLMPTTSTVTARAASRCSGGKSNHRNESLPIVRSGKRAHESGGGSGRTHKGNALLTFPSREEVRNIFCPHRFGHPFGLDIHENHPSHYPSPPPPVEHHHNPSFSAPLECKVSETPDHRNTDEKCMYVPSHHQHHPARPLPTSYTEKPIKAILPGMIFTVEPGFYFPDAAHAEMILGSGSNTSKKEPPTPSHPQEKKRKKEEEVMKSSSSSSSATSSCPSRVTDWLQNIPPQWRGLGIQVEDDVLILPPSSASSTSTSTSSFPTPQEYCWHPVSHKGTSSTSTSSTWGNVFLWPRSAYLAAAVDALQEQDVLVENAENTTLRASAGASIITTTSLPSSITSPAFQKGLTYDSPRHRHRRRAQRCRSSLPRSRRRDFPFFASSANCSSSSGKENTKWEVRGGGVLRDVSDAIFLRFRKPLPPSPPPPSPPQLHCKEKGKEHHGQKLKEVDQHKKRINHQYFPPSVSGLAATARRREGGGIRDGNGINFTATNTTFSSSSFSSSSCCGNGDGGGCRKSRFLLHTRLSLMKAMFRLVYNQRISIDGFDAAERNIEEDIDRIQEVCARVEEDEEGMPPGIPPSHDLPCSKWSESFSWFPTSCEWYPYDILVLTACVPKEVSLMTSFERREGKNVKIKKNVKMRSR